MKSIKQYTTTLFLASVCVIITPIISFLLLGWALCGSDRALKMCIALDQCGNAALGGNEDETISSRCGRAQRDGLWWGNTAANVVDFFFGKDHCKNNIGV